MTIHTQTVHIQTQGHNDCLDLTDTVRECLAQSNLTNGQVTLFVPGSTAGITTIEFEPGVVSDLKQSLEKLFPTAGKYAHHQTAGDNNGASHVRAAWIGPSLTVPFADGRLQLGVWQQIVLVDCDVHPRNRKYVVQIIGE